MSRCRLGKYSFKITEESDWCLSIPAYYAQLFDLEEPEIMKKTNTGWRDSKWSNSKYIYFIGLTKVEENRINAFCEEYQKFVIIGINDNIRNYFSNELDFCMALDFNAENPESLKEGKRTSVGELINQIKYKRKMTKLNELSDCLVALFYRIVKGKISDEISLSYIPTDEPENNYLPKHLIDTLLQSGRIDRFIDSRCPVIKPSLTTTKKKVKNLHVDQKIEEWGRIYFSQEIELENPVSNRSIIVIDDIYQSGATMWSYAKYLKIQGALSVFGLACVKTLRDTHN